MSALHRGLAEAAYVGDTEWIRAWAEAGELSDDNFVFQARYMLWLALTDRRAGIAHALLDQKKLFDSSYSHIMFHQAIREGDVWTAKVFITCKQFDSGRCTLAAIRDAAVCAPMHMRQFLADHALLAPRPGTKERREPGPECVVCMVGAPTVLLLGDDDRRACTHVVLCGGCAAQVVPGPCPLCRAPAASFVHLHLSHDTV